MAVTWLENLNAIPRLELAEYPTPLEPLPRLSAELGCQVYVKRDDQIGPGMGGNKTRKLEFLLADAQRRRFKKVVTFGGLQSNHARLTAAAANRLGMETHLFYFEKKPARFKGNLLLNRLLNARMHFIPLGSGGKGMSLETTIRLVKWVARLIVGRHYFIPVGGHSWLGCLGYVRAALEIEQQRHSLGLDNARLVVAAGSGGTLAGLMAGLTLCHSPLQLTGIDVGNLWKGFSLSIAHLASEICCRLGESKTFVPSQVPLVEGEFVGECYGVPSERGLAATHRLARCEGILLDPVYTAKAFAGLLALVEKGQVGRDESLTFLHTGGFPALFTFSDAQLKI